jgi:D-alanyl-lipoteichoic acid acyltransferase DltB (MBOAT superfamily)
MLFNSLLFVLAFLPAAFAGYFLLNRLRMTLAANAWLLFASLFFYGWWNVRYLPLILGSILFNYTIGGLLSEDRPARKRPFSRPAIFWFGIAANLAFLGWFKYADFLLGIVDAATGAGIAPLRIVLPLGISFFTITQIAFLVDAYEGLVSERNLLDYSLFVTFFPHLLAGPILHHQEMMPQFARMRGKTVDFRNLGRGIVLFAIGLGKKMVLADTFMKFAKGGFEATRPLNVLEGWAASLAYTFQLYFDFSGYSDMAVGIGLMFNIVLPVNFNSPYKATSVIEFWRRWHMTLSSFITTYVYAPIFRSFRKPTFGISLLSVFLSMFVSGLWHGAGWTFVAWGSLHGAALCVNHLWRRARIRMPGPLAWTITFAFVNAAFVVFRAPSFGSAANVLGAMAGIGAPLPREALEGFGAGALFHSRFGKAVLDGIGGRTETLWLMPGTLLFLLLSINSNEALRKIRPGWPAFAALALGFGYLLSNMGKVSEFLYFQF